MSTDPGRLPPPYALSIGLCDFIYRDRATGKRFILGCIGAVHAFDFPAIHPALGIFLDLTNGRGQVNVRVQIVDTDEVREPVWAAQAEVNFVDVRMVAELDFMVGGLSFPEPGEYRVQAFVNDQFLIERRLLVSKLERKP